METNGKKHWAEYISRINRVLDYIETHIYDHLKLDTLSRVADFSPFHFHRIFKAMTGETLNQFIGRVRVEKAANQLLLNPGKSITDIAFDCGFSGSAAFSRAFREAFDTTPSKWRQMDHPEKLAVSKIGKMFSKIRKQKSNKGKDFHVSSWYDTSSQRIKWRIKMKDTKDMLQAEVEVKEMREMHVAYVRHIGPYKGKEELFEGLFTKLMNWAGPRDLLKFPETKCLSVYHDSPEITDEDKLRLSVCITVPEDTKVAGEIGKMTVPAGKYAVARFEIDGDQYQAAWNTVYSGWLPESGYQPDDRVSFELYQNSPKEHPQNKHILDICVPVKPL